MALGNSLYAWSLLKPLMKSPLEEFAFSRQLLDFSLVVAKAAGSSREYEKLVIESSKRWSGNYPRALLIRAYLSSLVFRKLSEKGYEDPPLEQDLEALGDLLSSSLKASFSVEVGLDDVSLGKLIWMSLPIPMMNGHERGYRNRKLSRDFLERSFEDLRCHHSGPQGLKSYFVLFALRGFRNPIPARRYMEDLSSVFADSLEKKFYEALYLALCLKVVPIACL